MLKLVTTIIIIVIFTSLLIAFQSLPHFGKLKRERFSVVIIGSGISGLSAGSVLSMFGQNVLIIEKGENVGGSIQSFERDGESGKTYTFEPGFHVIGESFRMTKGFYAITRDQVSFENIGDVLDELYLNTTKKSDRLELPRFFDDYYERIKELFHKERFGIDYYREVLQTTTNISVTLDEILEFTNDEKLKYVLTYMTDFLDFEAPFPAVVYNEVLEQMIPGEVFPIGSTKSIVDSIVSVLDKCADCEILTNCTALHLMMGKEGKKVVGINTTCGVFESDVVISTMGIKNTFNEDFIDKSILQKHGYDEKVMGLEDSKTGMITFIGLNQALGLPKANVWYNSMVKEEDYKPPSYDDDDDGSYKVQKAFGSCLSCRDPDSPPDQSDFVIIDLGVKYEWFKKWEDSHTGERPEDYRRFKEKFEQASMELFFELFPQAKGHVDLVFSSSPLTIRDYLNHPSGSIYGAKMNLGLMEWNRKLKTKIKGLFVAGQDHFGPGIFNSMNSGISVAFNVQFSKNKIF